MAAEATRQRFSDIIINKRKIKSIDQKTLGLEIWPDVTPTVAQSRISRIERGDYWPPAGDIVKLIDFLNLWDDILNPDFKDKIILDMACEKFTPSLSMMAKMMSRFARENNAAQYYAVIRLLYETSINQEKSLQEE